MNKLSGAVRLGLLTAATLSCLMLGKAFGNFYNGNRLFEQCEAPMGHPYFSNCMSYIAGVFDALEESFCLSGDIELGQLRDVVRLWLQAHPEKRHLPASDLVVKALNEKFPCN
jgi:hypothetical protein